MTGARLDHADLVRALSDLRPPPLSGGDVAAQLCATVALGLFAALAVALLLHPLRARRQAAAAAPVAERPDLRRLRLVRQLAAVAPDEVAAFRGALYRPDAAFDESDLLRRLDRHRIAAR